MNTRTTTEPTDAEQREAFFATVAAEIHQVVAAAFQDGLPPAHLTEQYQAVLKRAARYLATEYGIPKNYLPDVLTEEQRTAMLLTAFSAVAAEQAQIRADLVAALARARAGQPT